MGVRLEATLDGGNAGPFHVEVGYLPPSGVGAALGGVAIRGGGFLDYDRQAARYAGAMHLEIGALAVKAVGLIETARPDGRPGYSFLILVSAEFAPIQLGFGWTLRGVGGLAGAEYDAYYPE